MKRPSAAGQARPTLLICDDVVEEDEENFMGTLPLYIRAWLWFRKSGWPTSKIEPIEDEI